MRVYLVESHTQLREALEQALRAAPGLSVVGSCGTVTRAVEEFARCAPHVAVIGDSLPDGDHLSLCWELAQLVPRLRVLFHVTVEDSQSALVADLVGASGCVLKQVRPAGLIEAVRQAFRDRIEDERRARGEQWASLAAELARSRELVEASRELCATAKRQREDRARARARRR